MSNITNLLDTDKADLKIFKSAGKVADKLNYKAYIVGGYVRDKLINGNKECEIKDIDITVDGDYLKYAKLLAVTLSIKDIVPFEQFKTVRLVDSEFEIEIAQTRKESYYKETRKPQVETATLEDDLFRRDFTINAIAVALNSKHFGDIGDPLGGIKDLNNHHQR